ncbi:MAG: hypothetical protein AAF206_28695 [Bacteroidota bacterium]
MIKSISVETIEFGKSGATVGVFRLMFSEQEMNVKQQMKLMHLLYGNTFLRGLDCGGNFMIFSGDVCRADQSTGDDGYPQLRFYKVSIKSGSSKGKQITLLTTPSDILHTVFRFLADY